MVAILLEGFEERAREEEEGLRLTTQGSHKSKALNTLKASMQAMLLDKYQFMWDKWRWATFDDPDESRFLQWPVSGDQHSPGGIRLDVPVPPNPHLDLSGAKSAGIGAASLTRLANGMTRHTSRCR